MPTARVEVPAIGRLKQGLNRYIKPRVPDFEHPESAAYVFGPENGSLDEAMLDGCTHIVAIPGRTCSNLAATVNVVLYDRIAKRWARVRHAFPPTDGLLRGVRGGYDRRLDIGDGGLRPSVTRTTPFVSTGHESRG